MYKMGGQKLITQRIPNYSRAKYTQLIDKTGNYLLGQFKFKE